MLLDFLLFFFFKQKTAYEMRISDWSSDVCSSDLYSGAKDTQKFVHELIGSDDPKGWDTQLKTEPGIVLSYERKWRGLLPALSDDPTGLAIDATPHVGVALGNIYPHANTGLTIRIGQIGRAHV